MKPIYLDYAAATPVADEVLAAMQPYWQEKFQNASALYLAGSSVKRSLEQARTDIAHWLGAKPGEIIFAAGATEANYLAVQGVTGQFPEGEVVVSASEHEAVLKHAQNTGNHKIAPIDTYGRVDIEQIEQLITEHTVLVSIHYANNETGTIQPLKRISDVIEKERRRRQRKKESNPIYLHTDAVQAAQYLDLHVNRLGVDLMTISAAKIYGPKQVAALYVKGGIRLRPVLPGGGQERGLRGGTENVAGVVGLSRALTLVQDSRKEEVVRVSELRDQLQENVPTGVTVNGHQKHRLPNFLSVSAPGRDGERLVMELDEAGLQAATGAACSANKDEPSHVLAAMALAPEFIQGSIRFSLGRYTTQQEVAKAIGIIKRLLD